MSLYNMMHGTSPATFFILPMLGYHIDDIPRYRDCFLQDEDHPEYDGCIFVYTRVGGSNRNQDCGESILYNHKDYMATYDDLFDNTYGMYVFKVPSEWKNDFDLINYGKLPEISEEYKKELYRIFPKLKGEFDKIFKNEEAKL